MGGGEGCGGDTPTISTIAIDIGSSAKGFFYFKIN